MSIREHRLLKLLLELEVERLQEEEIKIPLHEAESAGFLDRNEEHIAAAGRAWEREAWKRARKLPDAVRTLPQFRRWFDQAVHDFDHDVEVGRYGDAQDAEGLYEAFQKFFSARLLREPAVAAVYQKAKHGKRSANTRKRGRG